MSKLIILSTLSALFCIAASAQTEFGIDYRYRGAKDFSQHSIGAGMENFSGKSSWTLGVNYNFSDFGFGKNADKGGGFGVFAGYRYGFSYGGSGNLFGGLDLQLTFNKDNQDKSFTILSPSLEFGYHHTFNHFGKGAFASPAFGIGYNIQVGQNQENFDEGAFFQARTTIGYRF